MLRKRSRAVTGKQGTGGDQSTQPWLPPEKSSKPTSFFKGFFTISSETDATMSPTSILANTFFPQKIQPQKTISENKHSWEQPNNSKGIGIALVDTEKHNTSTKQKQKQQQQQERKLVVFGSQLRIHVPPSSVFHSPSPESEENPERQNMSMTDIEQSEDYTCVISHGPNPKTTHIFGNCVVQSCCGVDGNRNGYLIPSMQSFLSFCHQCKKQLGEGKDIYMYRGEKAFCSEECRCQGMLLDRLES